MTRGRLSIFSELGAGNSALEIASSDPSTTSSDSSVQTLLRIKAITQRLTSKNMSTLPRMIAKRLNCLLVFARSMVRGSCRLQAAFVGQEAIERERGDQVAGVKKTERSKRVDWMGAPSITST